MWSVPAVCLHAVVTVWYVYKMLLCVLASRNQSNEKASEIRINMKSVALNCLKVVISLLNDGLSMTSDDKK